MWDRLIATLAELTGRERALLALACGVALPLGAVFGVIVPQIEARAAARAALEEARAEAAWVADQARRHGALAAAAAPEPRGGPPLAISGIEASLVAAGLRDAVSELSDRGNGAVALRFERVRFTALSAWLAGIHPGWGYDLAAFAFEHDTAEDPDTIAASMTLEPAR